MSWAVIAESAVREGGERPGACGQHAVRRLPRMHGPEDEREGSLHGEEEQASRHPLSLSKSGEIEANRLCAPASFQ